MADVPMLIMASDLTPFATIESAKAEAMIEAATAQAVLAAPCLDGELDDVQRSAAKAILVSAIVRWAEAGTGAKVTVAETAGAFSRSETLDNSGSRRGLFWPSEIKALQKICKRRPAPFTIDMGGGRTGHRETCARTFGALYCDCGAELGMP
ncbi:hypothetical protein [Tessaracoccus sp.]|uniref:hypothetical protein n=1 Tax=Tessaracoccus sp. TaxID=1971211 RepID=UPI00261B7838|nr:hypothetical protein [Tessaracoccus sp.]